MAGLELKNVVKRFGEVTVVQQMDLAVQEGEFLVLLGESGCGKSTTLRMIAGLEEASEGQIFIGGRDVTQLAPMQRNIAMVFQSYALYPHMNVAQNMSFALEMSGHPQAEIQEKVKAAAKILNIESLLQRKPKDLSGGQRQRVAIGRAIVREPQVFLFDEPLSNLDAKLRGHMRAELALLHERLGKTTVYVTHDQVEAMTLATRIVIFDKGRIQQIGTPEEVFNRPANVFVAAFIGMPTMNFFKAQIRFVQGQMRLQAQGLDWPAPNWLAKARWPQDHPVTLGLRPQALRANAANTHAVAADAADANATHPRLTLAIEVVEYLGNESLVMGTHTALGTQRISAMVSGNAQSQHKHPLDFSFHCEDLHVFDSETGLSLRPRAA